MSRRTSALATSLTLLGVALTGCTSMSGLGGRSSYACKAPEGVTCESVSGTYANALQNNLPSQRHAAPLAATRPAQQSSSPASSAAIPRTAGVSPTPVALRSPPRILRLWFKPWEDADDDLYDQGYVYVQVDPGRWLIDHVHRPIRDAFAPVKAPPRATAGANEATPSTANGKGPVRPELPAPPRPVLADPRTRGDTDE